MKTNPLILLVVLLIAVLFLPSCAATGFGRKAPTSIQQQGPVKAFVWSVLTAPEDWDKDINPLEKPGGPLLWETQPELRKSPAYWTLYAFDPSYH